MPNIDNSAGAVDRQLGVASTRMDEHDRRIQEQKEAIEDIRSDIRKLESASVDLAARLKALEESTKKISDSVDNLVKLANSTTGFIAGFKSASTIWYAVIAIFFTAAGFVISKVLPLLTVNP